MAKKFEPFYRLAKYVARIPVSLISKKKWSGAEHLPTTGGFLVCPNHISEFDSLTFQHFMVNHNYPVRILCKEELFRVPVLGAIFRATKQIPVYRESSQSADVLIAAKRALLEGECVVIYPEGTLTRDPDFWPIRGKTGAARLALQTRVPLIPVVQWGAQDILDRYSRKPSLFPRKTVWVQALEAIDFSDLYDRAEDPAAWREATDRIIRTLHEGLEKIRQCAQTYAPLDLRDPDTPSKKELGLAVKLWRADHPHTLPSQRDAQQFASYLQAARKQLAARPESSPQSDPEAGGSE